MTARVTSSTPSQPGVNSGRALSRLTSPQPTSSTPRSRGWPRAEKETARAAASHTQAARTQPATPSSRRFPRRSSAQAIVQCCSLIALLHQPQLHQHDPGPPPGDRADGRRGGTGNRGPTGCNTATGATLAQQPEPRPQSVAHLPEPQCPVSTGTAQTAHLPWSAFSGHGTKKRHYRIDPVPPLSSTFSVETMGLEPTTPCLQSRCSSS